MTENLLDLATRAARAAGDVLRERSTAPVLGVSSKSTPTDLVSDADREAERVLIETISGERPGDGFLTEESDERPSASGVRWVLDPLDATINFLYRIPWWCVSVAVEDGTGTLAGAIYNPSVGEMFTASRGSGAFLNGSQVRVSSRRDIATALIGTGFSYDSDARARQAETVARILPRARDIRRAGSAALDLAHVATARLDGFYEAPMEPWDKAAGLLLVREAGGVITKLPGPQGLSDGAIVSGPGIHGDLVRLVLGKERT